MNKRDEIYMKNLMKKISLILSILIGVSLLNLLIVFIFCWFRGYRNSVAYSNGLFYAGFGYMCLAAFMMITNGTSFHNVRNYKVSGRVPIYGKIANNFNLTSENFGSEARESIQSSFSAFSWWVMLFIIGLITLGLSTVF
jgi:hypothetical protein